jgi:hypothetical protein
MVAKGELISLNSEIRKTASLLSVARRQLSAIESKKIPADLI